MGADPTTRGSHPATLPLSDERLRAIEEWFALAEVQHGVLRAFHGDVEALLGEVHRLREAATTQPGTRLIRFSEGLFESMAASFLGLSDSRPVTVEWGKADAIGAYTPTVFRKS